MNSKREEFIEEFIGHSELKFKDQHTHTHILVLLYNIYNNVSFEYVTDFSSVQHFNNIVDNAFI